MRLTGQGLPLSIDAYLLPVKLVASVCKDTMSLYTDQICSTLKEDGG